MIRLVTIALGLAVLTACATPKVLLQESFVPGHDKVAKESIKPVGTVGNKESEVTLSNYYIEICDIEGNEASSCRTSLILENITNYDVRPAGVVR